MNRPEAMLVAVVMVVGSVGETSLTSKILQLLMYYYITI
jgi:hypothetical protein